MNCMLFLNLYSLCDFNFETLAYFSLALES